MLQDLLEAQSPRNRKRIEGIISRIKKRDQKQRDFKNNRDVSSYSDRLDMSIPEYVRGLIEEYGRAEILDAGMGQGIFLTGLKMLFKDKIRTTGVTLQEVDPTMHGHFLPRLVDEEIFEPIEAVEFEPRFHAIFSVMSYEYFFDKARAMENIANGLGVNAEAHIQYREGFHHERKIFNYLAENGFEVDDGEAFYLIRVRRKTPSRVGLQEFYRYPDQC
jgi:hypothetical protein